MPQERRLVSQPPSLFDCRRLPFRAIEHSDAYTVLYTVLFTVHCSVHYRRDDCHPSDSACQVLSTKPAAVLY